MGISFDRATEFYDQTRALPSEIQQNVVDILVAELEGRCLEIGVGTGRFAIPISLAGIEVIGIDISALMLAKLLDKQSNLRAHIRVVRGDATRLPFASHSFDNSIACHVLHLIPDWKMVLLQLVKAVKPGGTLLFDLGGSSLEEKALEQLVVERLGQPLHMGLKDPQILDDFLESHGAHVRLLDPIVYRRSVKPSRFVDRILSNQFSFTWRFTDQERFMLAQEVMNLVRARFDDIETPREFETTIQWRAYDLPELRRN